MHYPRFARGAGLAVLAGTLALGTSALMSTAASASPVVTVSYEGNQVDNSHAVLDVSLNAAGTALTLAPVASTLHVPGSSPVDFSLNGSNPGWSLTGDVLTGTNATDPDLVAKDQSGDVVFFTLRGLSTDSGGVFHLNTDTLKCVSGLPPTFPAFATYNLMSPNCITDDVIMNNPVSNNILFPTAPMGPPLSNTYGSDGGVISHATPPVTYVLYLGSTGTSSVPGAKIDPNTGVISSDPSTAINGTHTYTVRVIGTDTVGAAGADEFQITVTASGVNPDAVTVTPVSNQVSTVGDSIGALDLHASSSQGDSITSWSETGLPAGLSLDATTGVITGTPTTSETSLVTVTATDSASTSGSASFEWTVNPAGSPPVTSSFGDFVNNYGNGFDSRGQGAWVNNPIIGWPAWAGDPDPAVHFLKEPEGSNFRLEYAPNGVGSGFCISNPGDDALVLRICNPFIWQQFNVDGSGHVHSAVNNGFVNPFGKGNQLTVGGAPTPWGGSVYHWVPNA